MSKIIVISAVAKNNIIGKNKGIPWHIKKDFEHFKKITIGHPIIMGSVTYESLPIKPLPGRENIVLNPNKSYKPANVTVMHSFEDAIKYAKKFDKAFIIGGNTVYQLGLEIADELELTKIDKNYEGDTKFPNVNWKDWKLIKKEDYSADDGSGEVVKFSFCKYKRINNLKK